MTVLLPIVVFSLPVLAIVVFAISGRRLAGSCGGMSPDGSCARCGKPAGDAGADRAGPCRSQ
ncbi:MAG: hypothetical protein JNM25_14355 [Planctomycetes bacterium]|nr:hypothetical protein [Planctomycetota bacterium]